MVTEVTEQFNVSEEQTTPINVTEVTESFTIVESGDKVVVISNETDTPQISDVVDIVNVYEITDTIKEITDGTIINQTFNPDLGEGDSMPLDREVDFVEDSPGAGDTTIYKGWAVPNSLTSSPSWKIQRLIIAAADGDVSYKWAGTGAFEHIWDDRYSLTY